jgi:hypothetical protein
MRQAIVVTTSVLLLTGCGGGGEDSGTEPTTATLAATGSGETGDPTEDADTGGADVAAAGTARVVVEGYDITLDEQGALSCSITEESVTFSFRQGDNEITLGGGANRMDSGWLGSIDFRVADPEDEPGPVTYFPDLQANGSGLTVAGQSATYSGPLLKQPPNDGSNPEPVDAGDGTITATCP